MPGATAELAKPWEASLFGWKLDASDGGSVPSVFAPFLAASVTTHHAQAEPGQCPEYSNHDCVDPERPDRTPEQEVYSDMRSVLDDEDKQYRQAAERGDHPAAKSPTRWSPLLRLLRLTLLSHLPSSPRTTSAGQQPEPHAPGRFRAYISPRPEGCVPEGRGTNVTRSRPRRGSAEHQPSRHSVSESSQTGSHRDRGRRRNGQGVQVPEIAIHGRLLPEGEP